MLPFKVGEAYCIDGNYHIVLDRYSNVVELQNINGFLDIVEVVPLHDKSTVIRLIPLELFLMAEEVGHDDILLDEEVFEMPRSR